MTKLMRFRTFLFALVLCALPASAFAGVFVSVNFAPPVLPIYAQPPCPGDGYLWTPGHWAYGPAGYYWVPGVWVRPPRVGLLWTPGYWAFGTGVYVWHPGYWGPHVGFYGGVNYGFGYTGVGFVGGMWRGGFFRYNTAVLNVNTAVVHNVYVDRTVIRNTTVINRASFNGRGGIEGRPTHEDEVAMHEQHFGRTPNQVAHMQAAGADRTQLASFNHGHPGTMAMNEVNGRRYDQQGRIANGVSSGQLNAHETSNLEGRESNLNRTISNDRKANDGSLTPQERQQVNQRQNNISRSIYNDKHNAATGQYGNNQVGNRRYNQQQRIANGIRSGQMNAGEAARAENRQQNINRQIGADRRANGGRLTGQERQNINRRQNNASRQIYRQNHNDRRAPR